MHTRSIQAARGPVGCVDGKHAGPVHRIFGLAVTLTHVQALAARHVQPRSIAVSVRPKCKGVNNGRSL